MTILLEAQAVSKEVTLAKQQVMTVLQPVDLTIEKGEFVAIMGPSGSGKSTLLYQMSGMDHINKGEVLLAGQKLSQLSEKELSTLRLKKMGFIFQQMQLLKNLNLLDNILLPGYLANPKQHAMVKEKAISLMERMSIDGLAENNITEASGGQLQRAAICRALINEPEIIFGDEPTGALNSKASREIMDIFSSIHDQGKTIVLVTHDVNVAARAGRILFIKDGSLVAEKRLATDTQSLEEREVILKDWLFELDF